jgi:hypothetical protein
MVCGKKIIPEAESSLRRMPEKRNSESRQSRGPRYSAQGKCRLILGSIELAKLMRLVPFAKDGRERRQVGIDSCSLRRGKLFRTGKARITAFHSGQSALM